MKKIISYLNAIAKDRYQHYALGFVIASIVMSICVPWLGFWWGFLVSIVSVASAAKLKEYYDSTNGGRFDWTDFVTTCVGGLTLWIVVVIIWIVAK